MKKAFSIVAVAAITVASSWAAIAANPLEQKQYPYPAHYPAWHHPAPVGFPVPVPVPVPYPAWHHPAPICNAPIVVPVPVAVPNPVYYPAPVPVYATQCVVPGVGSVWMAPGVYVPIGGSCTSVDAYGRPWNGLAR